jgi:CubicO group peptidase (beta-lactamase class C family)
MIGLCVRKNFIQILTAFFLCSFVGRLTSAGIDVSQKLDGFDAFMIKAVNDWNAPGVAVGIVVNGELVFSKGYGYRDYEKKLPFTPTTVVPLHQIRSCLLRSP